MTLDEARELFRTKGGQIKAFALHGEDITTMQDEGVLKFADHHLRLFGIPITEVHESVPEGVIV